MTTSSDIQTQPTSGLLHIDALLDTGPQWNFMTPGSNTISYTFSVSAGNQVFKTVEKPHYKGGLQAFNAGQQQGVKTALNYISAITGIKFVETANGAAADFHFANANLVDNTTSGLCSWNGQIGADRGTGVVSSYAPDAYIYLDNVEFTGQNAVLSAGTIGYQTHPFQGRSCIKFQIQYV